MCVCVCVCVCVCRNVNQIKTPLINSKIKLICHVTFVRVNIVIITNKCQYWATKLSKFTTNLPQLFIYR